ncbi:NAD-dependent DNA ligase LigA [Novisyntrophococcus fermenticellae]|uniref:NAD-dependent DNA ligase LigA n=1 Tax=Novisyntrophococcus fermenticellae TaxID=2068655 RepID=UPI001E42047A|nr:NAD-dependent DNA ligase LigA [Novisyntrophococcus fermenticellae]
MNKTDRIKELTARLNEARKAYYAEDREILSDLEYDRLYDELEGLELETGVTLANSPTQEVGYEAVDELPKERHGTPMLSLDKTKDAEALRSFIGGQRVLLSWKMDGLTIVLTYRDGNLYKAVTRGNGVIGEVVTNNARVFQNLPLRIPYRGELVLRGEAVISYSDFEKINNEIENVDARYKNPRNLCSGSVRQLNNLITAGRHVKFFAFTLVQAEGVDFGNSRLVQMNWLKEQGFETVEERMVTAGTLDEAMEYFSSEIVKNDLPSDGLVAVYDDIAYGDSLGSTTKFPRNAYAFKWADEEKISTLLEIEWSPSRTGLINPVAIFAPVELEGTTVSRASVHNVSIMKELRLGIGDQVEVYKANMIIPQIARNLTKSGNIEIPRHCPACGEETKLSCMNDVETLLCINPECPAKQMKAFTLFASRDALNIEGLSEETLKKFMAHGMLRDFGDIFQLDRYQEEIKAMDGFGEKSWQKLWQGIQKARHTTLPRLIYGLGIPNIGVANARMICREFGENLDEIRTADIERLNLVDGIGLVIAQGFVDYFKNEDNRKNLDRLLEYLDFEETAISSAQMLSGMIFVITGSVEHFANRSELKNFIEAQGGKVTGSVTSRTNYLINNDTASNSSKNRKAKELNIPILSEEDFLKLTKVG